MRRMKRIMAAVLTSVLLFYAVLPAFAEGEVDYNQVKYEFGDRYYFAYILNGSPDAPGFDYLYYIAEPCAETAYIPKTFMGVELTADNLTGDNLLSYTAPYSVDEDNPYFSVRDGVLFTKDGKTLVSCPLEYIYGRHDMYEATAFDYGFYRIPDGTEKLGVESVIATKGSCVVFPPSVTEIAPDCGIRKGACIAALPGSAAQQYAQEKELLFLPLGETHSHTWFRVENVATCMEDGTLRAECPCGAVARTETRPLDPDAHWFVWEIEQSTGRDAYRCLLCGKVDHYYGEPEPTDCACTCHALDRNVVPTFQKGFWGTLKNLVFRLCLFVWRMTGTHQYCECGARHY